MTMDVRSSPAQPARKLSLHLSPVRDLSSMKARQRCKIQEIRTALLHAGTSTLDKQAAALGLSRSTAWSILRANHKSSGLSAGVINRILSSPRLPPLARQRILEYIQERLAGLYGHNARRRREFVASLAIPQVDDFIVDRDAQPSLPTARAATQHWRRKRAPRKWSVT
jgi:hypothetical protein